MEWVKRFINKLFGRNKKTLFDDLTVEDRIILMSIYNTTEKRKK